MDILTIAQQAGKKHIPHYVGPAKRNNISENTKTLLEKRGQAIAEADRAAEEKLTKELRKSKRRDNRDKILNIVRNDLDVREWWLGLKNLNRIQEQPIQ